MFGSGSPVALTGKLERATAAVVSDADVNTGVFAVTTSSSTDPDDSRKNGSFAKVAVMLKLPTPGKAMVHLAPSLIWMIFVQLETWALLVNDVVPERASRSCCLGHDGGEGDRDPCRYDPGRRRRQGDRRTPRVDRDEPLVTGGRSVRVRRRHEVAVEGRISSEWCR